MPDKELSLKGGPKDGSKVIYTGGSIIQMSTVDASNNIAYHFYDAEGRFIFSRKGGHISDPIRRMLAEDMRNTANAQKDHP